MPEINFKFELSQLVTHKTNKNETFFIYTRGYSEEPHSKLIYYYVRNVDIRNLNPVMMREDEIEEKFNSNFRPQ